MTWQQLSSSDVAQSPANNGFDFRRDVASKVKAEWRMVCRMLIGLRIDDRHVVRAVIPADDDEGDKLRRSLDMVAHVDGFVVLDGTGTRRLVPLGKRVQLGYSDMGTITLRASEVEHLSMGGFGPELLLHVYGGSGSDAYLVDASRLADAYDVDLLCPAWRTNGQDGKQFAVFAADQLRRCGAMVAEWHDGRWVS